MMKNYFRALFSIYIVLVTASCEKVYKKGAFGHDFQILKKYSNPILLKNEDKQLLVSGEYQGRVLTSTSQGLNGQSYGWFNTDVITEGNSKNKISKIGGESRIWFGPDLGPNTIFFDSAYAPDSLAHGTPKDLDTLPFKLLEKTTESATFGNILQLTNFKGFQFKIDVTRKINVLDDTAIIEEFNVIPSSKVSVVGYDVATTMRNVGIKDWAKETGLLSIWDLGCYHPTPKTTVIIPTKGNIDKATVYFTDLDSTRIQIKNNILYYKADGVYLNKIGVLPEHTLPFFGSYSAELNLLTIIKFTFDGDTSYVNSHPVNIENQYAGDVINVFNDGVIGDIGPFGPFYELETSSKAKELKIGESIAHSQKVYHFEGNKEELDKIIQSVFSISIKDITNTLP